MDSFRTLNERNLNMQIKAWYFHFKIYKGTRTNNLLFKIYLLGKNMTVRIIKDNFSDFRNVLFKTVYYSKEKESKASNIFGTTVVQIHFTQSSQQKAGQIICQTTDLQKWTAVILLKKWNNSHLRRNKLKKDLIRM